MSFAKGPGVSNHPGAHSRSFTMRNSHGKTMSFREGNSNYDMSECSGSHRPGTASTSQSIFNVLLKAKKQGAQASHLVTRQSTAPHTTRNVVE